MAATSESMAALDAAQAAFDKASDISTSSEWIQPWTPQLVQYLSLSVLAFSLIALVLATLLLWRAGSPPQLILKVFGILSIIGFSALLLVAGYSHDQLTPIVGLFGAIAGYLLGKESDSDKRQG